jgi:hypothetical protein
MRPIPALVSSDRLEELQRHRTLMMTQNARKNGKNGPSQRKTVSMTKPSADMVTQFAIQ